MDITDPLYVLTREGWRAWLEANHETASDVWFVFYRQHAGQPSVPYHEAVEEALCVGWIDGIRKRLDAERYVNRFTPRRSGSSYSQLNRERLARLAERGRLHPSVAAVYDEIRPEAFVIPEDVRARLEARGAWAFFAGTSSPYQRIRAAHVDAARGQPAEFEKRLARLVEACRAGRRFGTGIEEFF